MELEQGDIILCTVDRIIGTIVFVKISGFEKEGTIIMSEIYAGRIRNIRDYVVPKKKIVCKVLRMSQKGNPELSLRRVTKKEKKEVLEEYKHEKSYENLLKSILKDKAEKIIEQIKQKDRLYEFIEDTKKDTKKLEDLLGKENAKKFLEIINKQKQKKSIIKKEFKLYSKSPDGISKIKNILKDIKDVEIKYLSAGTYTIKAEASDLKLTDQKIKNILEELEKKSKKDNIIFSLKENKKLKYRIIH